MLLFLRDYRPLSCFIKGCWIDDSRSSEGILKQSSSRLDLDICIYESFMELVYINYFYICRLFLGFYFLIYFIFCP